MGYLVRKADAFLREWKKNPDRKPLIIKGARQVGKTETIRTFARENYKNVIEINFITEPSYKVIVEEGFSAEHIIKLISRIDPTKHFEENETLIFLMKFRISRRLQPRLNFLKKMENTTLYVLDHYLGCSISELQVSVWGIKQIIRCTPWILKSFVGKGYSEEAISDMLCHMLEGVAFSEAEQVIFQTFFGILYLRGHACDCIKLY